MLKKEKLYWRRNIPANTFYRVCTPLLLVNRSSHLHVHYSLKNYISNAHIYDLLHLLWYYYNIVLHSNGMQWHDTFTIVCIRKKTWKTRLYKDRSSMGRHFLLLWMVKNHRCGYRHARKHICCCCSKRSNKKTNPSISKMAWHLRVLQSSSQKI